MASLKKTMLWSFIFLFLFCSARAEDCPKPLEDNEENQRYYDYAIHLAEKYGSRIADICAKIAQDDIRAIHVGYHNLASSDQEGAYYAYQVECEEATYGPPIYNTTYDVDYLMALSILDDTADTLYYPLRSYEKSGDIIDVHIQAPRKRFPDNDLLRSHYLGFYYLQCDCCDGLSVEEKIHKHLDPSEWGSYWKQYREYAFAQLENGLIYYHWFV